MINLRVYFEDVETTKEHKGYFYSVTDAIVVVILGCMCGLKNTRLIHQWATDSRGKEALKHDFGVHPVPSYYWLLCLLALVKPDSLNRCFLDWVISLVPGGLSGLTVSLDGKTIRSTGKADTRKNPLHIVSAQVSELGLTLAQRAVDEKSNEIPAVQELLKTLKLKGCVVVADALNCQKDTARAILATGADYLLEVKENQSTLEGEIREYVQDGELRNEMDTVSRTEKSRDRIEKRTAYAAPVADWQPSGEWEGLACIGAIWTEFERKNGKTGEWHYYISSRNLTAEELLHHARMEWRVESMHWLLDVDLGEDACRVLDGNVQQNLNMARKTALNLLGRYKKKTGSKQAITGIMMECLMRPQKMFDIVQAWVKEESA